MAVSGTISTTTFETRRVIDHAFRRCKLLPQQVGAEQIDVARDLLYLLLSNLANRGIQLWCIDRRLLPVYENQSRIDALVGTVDVLNQNFRLLTRLLGTSTSTAGGSVGNAFDDDFATIYTQTGPGITQTEFATGAQITTFGILAAATGALTYTVDSSPDGATWTTRFTVTNETYTAGTWYWYDIDGAPSVRYWRINVTAGTLSAAEIFFGNNPQAVPMSRLNRDNYTALTNRIFTGKPLQFWFDRQRDAPIMHIWPVTDAANRYGQIEVWRKRYIMDVGTLPQTLDIPQRWYNAVVARLAADLAGELPEVPDERMINLRGLADQAMREAEDEERDDSPIQWAPNISVYTR